MILSARRSRTSRGRSSPVAALHSKRWSTDRWEEVPSLATRAASHIPLWTGRTPWGHQTHFCRLDAWCPANQVMLACVQSHSNCAYKRKQDHPPPACCQLRALPPLQAIWRRSMGSLLPSFLRSRNIHLWSYQLASFSNPYPHLPSLAYPWTLTQYHLSHTQSIAAEQAQTLRSDNGGATEPEG